MDVQPTLVGRAHEREILRSAVRDAASGSPVLVLVHGEAGIGKTSLVREAAERVRADGYHVLIGQCLRFGANVTSYLPFTQALGQWLRTGGGDAWEGWVGHGGIEALVPSLASLHARPSDGLALVEIATVLERLQQERPTVVVLDDLQRADPSSLDVLTYLVAGFTQGQRLAVLATYRDTDLGEGHRLHGWLADADRMPAVAHLRLDRMDLWGIEELVRARGQMAPLAGVAESVHRRSGGNPYLADLLLQDSSTSIPRSGGSHLVEALLASWHRLSPAGRRVTQVLALAGSPVAPPVLRELGARFDLEPEQTVSAVREASAEGITVRTETGSIWFRHPLLAETIASTMDTWESAPVHAHIAAAWESAEAVDSRDRANALALHHVAAGDAKAGLHWSLRAADEAESVGSWQEVASHLSTAVSLLSQVPAEAASDEDRLRLLGRAARACEFAGDDRGAVAHHEEALSRVDRGTDPLTASRLLLELHILRDIAGYGATHLSTAEPREVLQLTAQHTTAPERALAYAQLAFAEVFNGLPEAPRHADTAVALAEASRDHRARVWALGARGQTRWGSDEGVVDSERALGLAIEGGDPQLICRSTIFLSNSYQSVGRDADAASATERSYRLLVDARQFDFAASVGANAAWWYFALGRWVEARTLVRELLTIARGDNNAGASRCVAALLAAYEGEADAAALHLLRAHELLPTAAPVGDTVAATDVLVAIATGRPLEALQVVEGCMHDAVTIDILAADEFLELASRAAVGATGIGARTAATGDDALEAYLRIEAARGAEPTPFRPADPRDLVHPALGALHVAQRAELLGSPEDLATLWERACVATERADMRFDHARSLYSLARHLLTHQRDKSRAASALAQARDIAEALGAVPLARDIDDLALQTHTNVPAPRDRVAFGSEPGTVPASPPLTPREREVLDGLLSGDTYAQIAARLFISDKTVSTHVSNLLRKTGASSRIELAELARRAAEA
ncbi:AAA family ATPase [Knoellia locipacati]|uniref:helix-turn-helix transcriptional regulator n=1 Tax=Knoellia locipacati TaxID=882824 RepID=UPI00384BB56B